ncbi:hypothetical protein T4B_9378 [Trichinella pseudospiralis]|uniref:PiggyBac transposable element-derived protein domain-containing protein n=1 Tax=Trichinella pseudospiralis TaxID=6337 RepID=A0A0V1J091_TRIPS|nr:hypothetical protein T4A_3061 [Trichinella pseudospiralis]KRZ27989.1 hypothetical protein T4B_9378 [Trichinella pseudospiralis]KRZ42412.1 hypothetical protein T4C_11226 [Trichinella pseudospiralis]
MYNSGPCVPVDRRLAPCRDHRSFKQYMLSNSVIKFYALSIKIWTACDTKSNFVWNVQIYTGKAEGKKPAKNQGMRIVTDLTKGLKGRNVTDFLGLTSLQWNYENGS